MLTPELYIGAGLLIFISVLASKASDRMGIPALTIFLGIGMLAGEEGLGGIKFNNVDLAQGLGVLALNFILFSGGLDTNWRGLKSVLTQGILLSTLGVLITSGLVCIFVAAVLPGFGLLEGALLGAIISSTDAAAVFTVLRSNGINLKDRVRSLLELESGSNDPMAAFLTITLLGLITQGDPLGWSILPVFVQQMAVGALVGLLSGKGIALLIKRLQLTNEGLYPVMTLSLVVLTYGMSEELGGNGFLATYFAGLFLGREPFALRRSLSQFHDGLAWLMQIAMFLVLGLLVNPSQLMPVIKYGVLLALFMIFVARPLAVYLMLIKSRFSLREKTIIGWVGLRGAVPIILATYPYAAGVPQAETIFNMVFFIVLTSVLVKGTTLPWVARWLRVDKPQLQPISRYEYEHGMDGTLLGLETVTTVEFSRASNRKIAELFPAGKFLIALIQRGKMVFIPRGVTSIRPEDKVMFIADDDKINDIKRLFDEPQK